MKTVIVGPGAMGCLLASYMLNAGFEVSVLDRNPKRVETIRSSGLVVEQGGSRSVVVCRDIFTDAAQIGTADTVFITVKSYDTPHAAQAVLPAVAAHTAIVSFQNGLFNVETIKETLHTERVAAAVTSHGATLMADGHIRHVGKGDTLIGNAGLLSDDETVQLKKILETSGITTSVSGDIHAVLWGKLLINAAINPVTAIAGIKNGALLNSSKLMALMGAAVSEVCRVAKANGITIPFPDPMEKVKEVCRLTAENTSSMLADIRAGRRTEIDYINGAVVSYGSIKGIDTPVNRMLMETVNALAKTDGPSSA